MTNSRDELRTPGENERPRAANGDRTRSTETGGLTCRVCRFGIHPALKCDRLRQVALSLSLFSVPAFITDPVNRFIWVNSGFARLVGDPVSDGVPLDRRVIHGLVAEVYRDRFVQGVDLVATCLPVLVQEIEHGHLAPGARQIVDGLVADNPDLRRALSRPHARWDGLLLINDGKNRRRAVREQVAVVADPIGEPTGFHIGLWFPAAEQEPLPGPGQRPAASVLTFRQLEIAKLYASGLTSAQVAARAGTTTKTARAHLEQIYGRLEINSRAQLALMLARAGIV